jgi:hypothetical protein
MRNLLPGRYLLLALVAGSVSVVAVGMATGSLALISLFALPLSGLLGWLASSADAEARRHG